MQPKVFVLLCAILPAGAQVINIDTFNDGDFTQPNTTEQTYTGTSMLGGERRVTIFSDSTSTASVASGLLSVSDPFGSFAILRYGTGDSSDPTKHLHLDVLGYPSISLVLASASQPATVLVQLFSLENGSQQSGGVTLHINAPGEYVATYGVGTLNLANISGLSVIVPGRSTDVGTFVIDSIRFTTAVPEPATYQTILGVGVLMLAIKQRFFA